MAEHKFELRIDGVPYSVRATPFEYNAETRYKVDYNGNEYIFCYDPTVGRLAPLDSDAGDIPDNLEEEIVSRLSTTGRPAGGNSR